MVAGHARLVKSGLMVAVALCTVGTTLWLALDMDEGPLRSDNVKAMVWPWSPLVPDRPLQAQELTDPVWQFAPWFEFARRELAGGRLPLWNPHQDGGVPFLANPQTTLATPLTWPILLLGVDDGWNISLLARLLLAAVAALLWLRQSGRSVPAAALGAALFTLAGPSVAWLAHPIALTVAPVPLVLLFATRLATRGRRGDALGLAAATFLVVTGGHPETAVAVAALAGFWLLAVPASWSRRALTGGVALSGAALAGPVLVPFVEYFVLSEARFGSGRLHFTLPVSALKRLVTSAAADSYPVESAAFLSVVGLVLACIGAAAWRAERHAGLCAVAAGAVLAVAYRNPLAVVLAEHTTFYWTRLLVLLPLVAAYLAALGLDTVRSAAKRAARPVLVSALSWLGVAVVAAELLAAAHGVHAISRPEHRPRSTPLLDVLAADPDVFRILPLHTFLPPNAATALGLDDVRGYDALAPRGWRTQRVAMGRFGGTRTVSDVLEPWELARGGAALDHWNVKYLLLHPQFPYDAVSLGRDLALDLEEVYRGADGVILRNRRCLPRVRLEGESGTARIVTRTPVLWKIEVATERASSLVVANPFFPGWRARVDGRRVRLTARPGEAIELLLEGGTHSVELTYRPVSVLIGLALAAAGAGALALTCGRRRS
jgi:hypothetical protein